jgi:hypothetical protein
MLRAPHQKARVKDTNRHWARIGDVTGNEGGQERCQSRNPGVVRGSGEEAADVEDGRVGQHGLAVGSLYVGVVGAVCAAVGARTEKGPTVDSSHGQLSTEDGRTIPGVDGKLYYSDMNSVARRVLIHVAGCVFAVGMGLAAHPPHRSRRAGLPHRAPVSGQTHRRCSG